MTRRSSLSGSWSGAFRYPGNRLPEVVFNVQIEEVGGSFTGSLQEPNWRGDTPGAVITSDIDGDRTGQSVRFIKFYDGSGALHHAVRYEGAANEALTRIEGTWTVRENWSGTFVMTRDDDGAGAEAEERAEVIIERNR